MAPRARSIALSLGFCCLVACTTTNHGAFIKPIRSDKPVSASSFYLDRGGNTVQPRDYTVVKHVQFNKVARGSVAGETKSEIDISEDLGNLFQQHQADALVNFQVYAEDYDPGNTYATGFFRIFGSMALGLGLPFLAWGIAEDDSEFLIPFGAGFGGTGLVSLLLSFILPSASESVWTIGFEGDLAKRR